MKKKKNSFSIIVPTYNSEKAIIKTIDSILKQNYEHFEVIIIDDGSNDNTKECLKKYNNNEKVKYYFQENSGVSSARNNGISKAKNEFIMFVDLDDELLNNALNVCNEAINLYDADLYSFNYMCCTQKTIKHFNSALLEYDKFGGYFNDLYSKFLFNQLWNKVYKKSIIENNNITLNKELSIAEDLKFNIDYCRCSNRFIHIDKDIYKYNLSNNGLGLKFRLDSGYIKINIDLYLKKELKQNKEDIQLIDKIIIKDIYSFYSKIVDKRYEIKTGDKIKLINEIQKKYKNDIANLYFLKIKYKLLLFFLIKNNICLIYIISMIANKIDRINKRRKFGL